jgi:Fe-S cluster assembly iron-binding protein IscA
MIAISQNAANQIHKMLAKNGLEGGGLRVGVKAAGCSGYEYTFAWEKEPRPTDGVFVGRMGAGFSSIPRATACSTGPSWTTTRA